MLKAGQRVRVFLDEKTRTIYNLPIRNYHNKVSKIVGMNYYKQASMGMHHTYYLEGFRSRYGVPYEFCEEWLIPIDVEVDE